MLQTLMEQRGLTIEHARGWVNHVGLTTPIEQVEGDAELVPPSARRSTRACTRSPTRCATR